MFSSREYLKLAPWDALIQIVNDQAYLQLDAKTTTLKKFTPLAAGMAEVVLGTHRSSSDANILPVLPDLTFRYQRLILQDFFRQTSAIEVSGIPLPFSTHELVDYLSEKTGIVFDVDDFNHQYFDTFPTDDIVLTASERSLRWLGSLIIRVVDTAQVVLSTASVVELPEAFNYPSAIVTKTQAIHYTMQYDFTAYREVMMVLSLQGRHITGAKLAGVMKAVTGMDWVCQDAAAPLNICTDVIQGVPHYRILYAGPSIKRYTARTDKNWVVVLQLDETRCTDLTGALRLHFD